MLELKKIFKWVNNGNNRVFLLKDINLSVKEGEFISIMGPSGSGKSTLLNVIGMLDEFDEGEYEFFYEPVHKLKEKQRTALYKQYIGFVFQDATLLPWATARPVPAGSLVADPPGIQPATWLLTAPRTPTPPAMHS